VTIASGLLDLSDTIVALGTAHGRGALSIVRLSGTAAHAIARGALAPWPTRPRVATRTSVRDENGAPLDEAIAIRYDAPASFTGEDAVEIVTHGGALVPATVLASLVARGARMAMPGEFTRRAVLNGKLDILQAEATGDLIAASSRAGQREALRQLDGGLTRRVLALRDQLIGIEALIAYDIDFPDEDDGPIAPERITVAATSIVDALERLLATARVGELVREGALVVLAGAPNVGKSSLFNALLGERRAIVTDIPGTTRDAIEGVIDTPSLPLRLVDTAGLRDAVDPVERLGVEVSASYVSRAAIVLICADSLATLDEVARAIEGRTTARTIAVHTKADLATTQHDAFKAAAYRIGAKVAVRVSAESGAGLDELVQAIVGALSDALSIPEPDVPLLTNARHRFAISRALDEARAFHNEWGGGGLPLPVVAVHLHEAVAALEDLIGVVDIDEILDEVFRRFCVGK
jgi:tRNA modification GTPase